MSDEEGGLPTTLPATRIPEGEPPETYADLGRDYPLTLVAGGLAAGLLAGILLPRGAGRKLAKGAAAMAIAAGEVSRTYGKQAIDAAGEAAGEGREKLKDLSHEASDFGKKLSDAAGPAAAAGKDLGMRLIRLAIGLLERM